MESSWPCTAARDNPSRSADRGCGSSMLTAEEEQALCRRWRDRYDLSAVRLLIRRHARLVVKIADGYRGYGLCPDDLICAGQMGLMRAVCRFDPDRGMRFATYAASWVHAAIRDSVLRKLSSAEVDPMAARERLSFDLRPTRRGVQTGHDAASSAAHLGVSAGPIEVPGREAVGMH